nr:MAG TPA: hypothetical protein [Caudoviricetes sp.]
MILLTFPFFLPRFFVDFLHLLSYSLNAGAAISNI